ncbi:nuclear transport factor 2 family protein [Seongchinamella unica]|uniref:Nuclear transport factor 2 family protein n=1 Tax=Seongchinamella unica TaxID=2547392 RepID=A0A4R5LU92_9GAMM|nr:nuclear transport factor 2 family protein [Seongchinamella unica]TDG14877.1 nuclear transport factor 2 family protein [Seongchinamella unica]
MTDPSVPCPSPAEVDDRLAIIDVLLRHCRGLDRNDAPLLKRCYWPEAEVDYGSFKGPAHSFAELIGPALAEAYELTRHCIGNTLVELQGDTALVESYVRAGHLFTGGQAEMCFEGRYLDRLQKRAGRWGIIHRQVVMDWSRTRKLEDARDSEAFADLARGRDDDRDPLHAFLAGGNTA